jgi:hypothetical protein
MQLGYIIPNKLPYGPLILFVEKKDDKSKMCIDYCALKKIKIKNNYFMPCIDDLLDQLNGTNIYVKLI